MRTVIVDLDGTYYRGNTLHDYLRCALKVRLRHFDPRGASILLQYLLRGLRLISHANFKERALRAAVSNEALEDFAARATGKINLALKDLLDNERRAGSLVILASAALEFYIPLLWDGEFTGSQFSPETGLEECRGERKLEKVNELLKIKGASGIDLAISDHLDDLPLMRAARERILVSPGRRTVEAMRSEGLDFTLFK